MVSSIKPSRTVICWLCHIYLFLFLSYEISFQNILARPVTTLCECVCVCMCVCWGGAEQITGKISVELIKKGRSSRCLHFPSLTSFVDLSTYTVHVALFRLSIKVSVYSLKFDIRMPRERRSLCSLDS